MYSDTTLFGLSFYTRSNSMSYIVILNIQILIAFFMDIYYKTGIRNLFKICFRQLHF